MVFLIHDIEQTKRFNQQHANMLFRTHLWISQLAIFIIKLQDDRQHDDAI
jgi:hypothetical protein